MREGPGSDRFLRAARVVDPERRLSATDRYLPHRHPNPEAAIDMDLGRAGEGFAVGD